MNKEVIKNDIYKLRRHEVANDNPFGSITHPRIETVRLDSVINILDRFVLTPVPSEVAALIQYQKEKIIRDGQAKQKISPREVEKSGFDVAKAVEWVSKNYDEYCSAYANGYVVEDPKTYRFTVEAFHEIDVRADSIDEAQKRADEVWKEYYDRQRDFGEAKYMGLVDHETGEVDEYEE